MFSLLQHLVVCRCCLLEQPPLYHNIYDNNLSAELLALAPSLRVEPNDGLTDVICDQCLHRVREALEFRQSCEQADRVLRERHEQWCRTVAEGEALALDDVLECLEREVGSLEEQPTTLQLLHKPIACVAPLMESIDFGTLNLTDTYQCDYNNVADSWLAQSTLNTPTHFAAASLDYGSTNCASMLQLPEIMTAEAYVMPAAESCKVEASVATATAAKPRRKSRAAGTRSSSSSANASPKSLHPCSECEKKFTRNFQLKLHLVSVHGLGNGLRYQCEICQKTFASRHSLRYHVKSLHSSDRPFPCEHCDRRFVLRTQLVSHLRMHTGESKPRIFACAKCQKTWPTKSDLRTHMRTHDPHMERPFKCDRCSKSFFTRGHLNSHILVHTGEKPYTCEYCSKSYQSVGNLNNHMVRQHGDIIEAQLGLDIES